MLSILVALLALTRLSAGKAVFAHYMVGSMTSSEASQDISNAIAAGFDGFALNTHTISSSDTWNTDAINYLLNAAQGTNFKMFLSFDMSWNLDVASLGSFLLQFSSHSQYYTTDDGRPWVSTYDGGSIDSATWDSSFIQPLVTGGVTPYFVPDFDDWSGFPQGFFDSFPVVDGAFSWESAWPSAGSTAANVSDSVDESLIQQAHAAGKVYMMPLSTFQFKYLGSGQDWYRIGETNLPERMAQILALQPDFVEVITWNDAGESHYVGSFWPEQIAGTNEDDYANGFDHTGWQKVIKPFITAFKNGATEVSSMVSESGNPEGAIWYRTLLTSASCSSTITNYQQARDAINFAVILPSSSSPYTIEVYSNNQLIGTFSGVEGLNYESVPGLQAGGGQYIQVLDSTGDIVASANGTKNVLSEGSDSSMCNWNYEVVGLP
ncbi:glucan endo-1,3-alpha-glucosidase agn1 precursor, putative [Talaromyces stipitatus ATCC 10500]|uniref:Glucan endo-1,3-alpha-glucosidase agn1, putative n=1 Tax=Talaromyces stipitatus (strain ATCC 10500 / CBS 375.48 / QM 6759 / NRRL 1006) TaxID=441959 RepID=B8MJX6_TALSN|nr:glucan endo-1,3-alpha-glucosidase agn1 precursor, putative [Talaromyces stipitatus ATCC 10500]EED14793.1 glucan endo-1,3-alpha-glucosidase agn1 precursor, putative [Talaromyces stipitatus ATCC 10500]